MKKKTLLFSLLLTFLAPWTAMAQETLTVYSNTTLTQSNAPMFVEYFKNYTITQTVFPASDLTAMSGKTITAITFYTTSTNIPYTTQASAVIYLKEVQNATISAYIDKSTATTVCTGYYEFVSDGNDGGMVTITFTTPFPYNGGNLLFGCENTNRVDCQKMSFKGISQSGASMGGQSTSLPITGTNQRNFLPKTTFTYTFTYSQPVNLQVSSVTDQSATLTWQAPETTSTIVGYSYNYKEHSASEWSTDYQANGTEATLNNLDSFTEYDFRVKALYSGNHESSYVTTTFRTECATITVTAETPWTENFEDFYHVTHAVISPNSDNKAFRMDDGCWNMVNLETGGFNPVLYTSYSDAAFSGSSSVQFYNRGGASILILPEFTNTLNTLQFEFKASYFNIDTQGTLEIGYYYGNAFHAVCTSDRITCGRGSSGHNAIGDYMGPYPLTGEIPSGSRMALRYTPLEGAVIGSTSGVSAGAINLDDFRVSIIPTKTISGVGTEHWADKNGGYYLIASPLATAVDPATVGMITNNDDAGYTYNLYYFDQAADKEWRSYAASSFNLMPGKGYLYASKNGTTLTFTGTPYSGDGKVTLSKVGNARFSGWNLVGNPFHVRAYINRDFYIINPVGRAEIIPATDAERTYVEPMEGIFVIAESNNEEMTFSTTAPGKKAQAINVNVTKANSRDAAVIDRAIVRFDESRGLPKFQLNPNHTKIYIPQNGTDYAVVNADNAGEMPVNFKAEADGQYTISFNAEEVSFNYLHLIDNLTGADVDLLATPSYTFTARTTDYASRFKLVFAATGIEENGASTGSATFAYNNGSEWIINNPSTGSGSATLQVIDMMGRVLSSETINGATTKAINAAQGIYMLRLINGENVKVQKIVVR